jgi:hypothetical protein
MRRREDVVLYGWRLRRVTRWAITAGWRDVGDVGDSTQDVDQGPFGGYRWRWLITMQFIGVVRTKPQRNPILRLVYYCSSSPEIGFFGVNTYTLDFTFNSTVCKCARVQPALLPA